MKFDKLDLAILMFLTTALAVSIIMIAYGIGATTEMQRYRKDAIERNFAHYIVDSSGKTEFRWKAPVRSQDNVNESLVYRINL
jgi:glutathione peroxidase-family protein